MKRKRDPAEGERNAITGYHPQYRLCARAILSALRHETLEWVRLADPKAGHVDDFQIGRSARVDAYQVKWTRDGGNFSFNDLIKGKSGKPSLIKQLADGWQKVGDIHPTRRIVVHLQTNETPSVSDRIPLTGPDKTGTFAQFHNQVWIPFRELGTGPPVEWVSAWNSLVNASGLEVEEFDAFIKDCELNFGLLLPGKGTEDSTPDPDYARDLKQLTELVESLVADPAKHVEFATSELLKKLGWLHRLSYFNKHDFPDPEIPYREIQSTARTIRLSLETLDGGYLLLLGNPGSGKSTLLTKTLPGLPHRLIRYYAFVPDSMGPRTIRGETISFFHDLSRMLDDAGFRTGESLSNLDKTQLLNRFHDQIQLIGEDWKSTGRKTVILVDGLDHIPREQKPQDSFLKHLPDPGQMPNGVLFVLGSQTDQLIDLPSAVHRQITSVDRRIEIERLSRESVTSITEEALPNLTLDMERIEKIQDLVSGHPLALSILLNRMSELSTPDQVDSVLSSTEPFGDQIEEIYHGYWRQVIDHQADQDLAELLGKLARLRQGIDLIWVERWAGYHVVDRLRRNFYHLFRRETKSRWYIFHNSFRQFLIERSAESEPDGFDPQRDRRIHAEIAELCSAEPITSQWNWEEVHHRCSAGQHDKVLHLVESSRLRTQLLAFRPIDLIEDEIRSAVRSAGALRDPIALMRLIILGAEFATRKDALLDTPIHELLFKLGEIDLALIHTREGQNLLIAQTEGLDFALDLHLYGYSEEARRVFEAAEPIALLANMDRTRQDLLADDVEVLDKWAHTVNRFRALPEIVRLIRGCRQHSPLWDHEISESEKIVILQNRLLFQVGYGLVETDHWNDLDLILEELRDSEYPGERERFWLFVHGWKRAVETKDPDGAKDWITRASDEFDLEDLENNERIALAEGFFRIARDTNEARRVFEASSRPEPVKSLGAIEDLKQFMARFRHSRLLFALGSNPSQSELIPEPQDWHERGFVYFERGISEIARLWSLAWKGNRLDGSLLLHECGSLLKLFNRSSEESLRWFSWHSLLALRPKFYGLLGKAAREHGGTALRELALALDKEWFAESTSRYWPLDDIREIVSELHDLGVETNWCRGVLERLQQQNEEYPDRTERISWRKNQGLSWIQLDEKEKARSLFQDLLRVTAGIGYRKDFQLDSWIEWMGPANKLEPDQAASRIRLVASGIVSLVRSTEGPAASSAAEALIARAFEWSPVRAVRLADTLSAEGAISYSHAAATIVAAALHSSQETWELCLSFVANIIVPISTSANIDLATNLSEVIAKNAPGPNLQGSLDLLIERIKVYGLHEARDGWFYGVKRGLLGCGCDPSAFELPESEKDEDEDLRSSERLTTLDGREFQLDELLAISHQSDLLSLIDAEASESFFNWIPVIQKLAESWDTDEILQFANDLSLRSRQAIAIAILSERVLQLGERERALGLAQKAVDVADPRGWSKFYDGGSMLAAYSSLLNIDPARARNEALDSLVLELTTDWWFPLNTAQQLDELAPILCEDVPTGEIWSAVEDYLHESFLEVPLLEESLFNLSAEEIDEPSIAMSKLICGLLDHLAHVLSHGAQRSCLDLLRSKNVAIQGEFKRILETGESKLPYALVVLEAISKEDPELVRVFQPQLEELRRNEDQSIRWSSNRIAQRLGLPPVEQLEPIDITSRYRGRMILPESKKIHGAPESSSFDILPDTFDPRELVAPWLEHLKIIVRAAEMPFEPVLMRAVQLMYDILPQREWNSEGEHRVREILSNQQLKFPFCRPRSTVSRRAIFRVLAELVDGGRIPEDRMIVLAQLLRICDSDFLLNQPLMRPRDIMSVERAKYDEYKPDWVEAVATKRDFPLARMFDNRTVIGEKTHLKPSGNGNASESRRSMVCHSSIKCLSSDIDVSQFFPTLCCETLETYPDAIMDSDLTTSVTHSAYGYLTPGHAWLAFNPRLARSLGWSSTTKGLFAWESDGETMVETIWWNDGMFAQAMPYYRKSEVGEGWIVVASEKAERILARYLGEVKRFCAFTREVFVDDKKPKCLTKYVLEDL